MDEAGTPPVAPRRGALKGLLFCGCPLAILLACAGFAAAIVFGVLGLIRSSDAYQLAMSQVRGSAAVGEALGSPIEEGTFVSGNISTSGQAGSARLSIPISGPKADGQVEVDATRANGEWRFRILQVHVASGPTIDLLGVEEGD